MARARRLFGVLIAALLVAGGASGGAVAAGTRSLSALCLQPASADAVRARRHTGQRPALDQLPCMEQLHRPQLAGWRRGAVGLRAARRPLPGGLVDLRRCPQSPRSSGPRRHRQAARGECHPAARRLPDRRGRDGDAPPARNLGSGFSVTEQVFPASQPAWLADRDANPGTLPIPDQSRAVRLHPPQRPDRPCRTISGAGARHAHRHPRGSAGGDVGSIEVKAAWLMLPPGAASDPRWHDR